MRAGIPTMKMVPHRLTTEPMTSMTMKSPKLPRIKEIVDLAQSMYPYPVTDITIIAL